MNITMRQHRALAALLRGDLFREELDRVCGCSNFPEVAAQLRRKGFKLLCTRVIRSDRDGLPCRPGIYHLLPESRAIAHRLLSN